MGNFFCYIKNFTTKLCKEYNKFNYNQECIAIKLSEKKCTYFSKYSYLCGIHYNQLKRRLPLILLKSNKNLSLDSIKIICNYL